MQLTSTQRATRYMASEVEFVQRLLNNHDINDERALKMLIKSRWNALSCFDAATEPDACIEVFVSKGKASFIITNPHDNA